MWTLGNKASFFLMKQYKPSSFQGQAEYETSLETISFLGFVSSPILIPLLLGAFPQ